MENYNKIFIKREFKAILGKCCRNFWILVAVFAATIFAMEFSRSGIKYLDHNMNDPFIHWVDVQNPPEIQAFLKESEQIKDSFNISTIEENYFIYKYVFSKDFVTKPVVGRTIAYNSDLLNKILDEENAIVTRPQAIDENDYGWIVTKDLMLRLGYEDEAHYPLYINYTAGYSTTEILEQLGLKNAEGFFEIPIPIIAVVEQLPDLLDFIAPTCFMEQDVNNRFILPNYDDSNPDKNYFAKLYLVAENPDDSLESRLKNYLKNAGIQYDNDDIKKRQLNNLLRPATQFCFVIRDSVYKTLNKTVPEIFNKEKDLYRTYKWDESEISGKTLPQPNYLSFMFEDLSKVKTFSLWAKERHGIRIDMAQIEAKENFNTFNILSSMLCLFIAIIAIAFVSIFLYFLIDSHFRRISKNLGTIMAFGLANKQIIRIYLAVFLLMIITSLLAVMAVLGLSELVFNTMNWWQYEGKMPHFSFCDAWVIITILVIPLISALATVIFLSNKLKATPGDLIFERNV